MRARIFSLIFLLLLTAGLLHAVPTVYVDSAADFSPANPSSGQTVTWKPGTADAVSGLRFGTTAFSSVQAGIDAADAGGTVFIAAGTYDGGVVLDIDKNLLVRGDGDDATFLSGGSNGDNGPDSGEHRVLDISSSTAVVTLDDLAIVDGQGNVTGGSAVTNNKGGGILNLGILTLNRCLVARNVVSLGGGIYNEGTLILNSSALSDNRGSGLANDGDATINSSTINGNFNFNDGGGLSNFSNATMTVNDSVIANNEANYGAGIANSQDSTLDINNSEISQNSATLSGGGLRNHAGIATLNDCLLESNTTTGEGGGAGIHNSAGFNGSTSRLNVYDSILSANRSTAFTSGEISRGGGLLNDGIAHLERSDLIGNVAEFGGGLFNKGNNATLTMVDSTFDGNIAQGSGGFSSAGALYNERNATITNSTFSANEADDEGGAIINSSYEVSLGGGSYQQFGAVLNLTNCTLSGNSAVSGGAIYNNNSQGVLNLVHCTVTGNEARFNSGINNDVKNTSSDGTLNLTNSIVVGNISDPRFPTGVNVAGPVNSIGNNLTEIPTGHTLASILDPLEENGGPTQTHALPSGSPAIDGGNQAQTPDSLTKDQRGARRNMGFNVDIGAYEAQVQPQITFYSPGKDTNLKAGSVILIRFTRALSTGNGEVRLRTFSGTIVPSSITFSSGRNDLYITVGSLANIPAGTRFYVEIDGDALLSTSDGVPYSGTRDSRDMSFFTAPSVVYVDAAADFSPANPSAGATVTWKPGASDQVTGLIYGSNAFSTIPTAFAGVRVGGEIRIAAGTYDEGSELVIDSSVTLRGDGANQTILSGGSNGDTTISAGEHRVMSIVGSSSDVTLQNLAVVDGAIAGSNAGGGVNNPDGGQLTIESCTFMGNTAGLIGGAIASPALGSLTMINSTLSNNLADLGGAVSASGIIINSTFSGNLARLSGGAILTNHDLSIINSTITGNTAGIEGNYGVAGGIANNSYTLTLNNTIVAGNFANGESPDISSSDSVATGVNFIGDLTDSGFTTGSTVLTYVGLQNIDDLLHTTLSDLGGTTLSHALVPGGPAINAGNDAALPADTFDLDGDSDLAEALPVDQLGFARIVGGSVDIGAVEFVAPPLITAASPVDGTTNFNAADALVYVFDQDVLVNTAAITLRSAADDSIIPATITAVGDTVTISPDAPLDEATGYYVEFGTQTISNLNSTAFFYGFSRVNFTSGIINAYVDAAGDFTPANPSKGQAVTWNGASGAVAGLTFGVNAFDNIQEAADLVVVNGTVFIATGTYTEGAQVEINDSLTLQGDGATATILSGEDSYRPIYTTTNGKHVIINDLSITQGSVSGTNSEGTGGGILNDASLTLNRVMLYDNFASNGGGAISSQVDSELTINDSTLYDNQAGNRHGPGDTTAQTGIGGAILTIGEVVINNSTLSGNYARNDGGAINIQFEEASLEMNHSTIVDNESFDITGGVYSSFDVSSIRINNSIIADNIGGDVRNVSELTFTGVNFIGNVSNLSAFRPDTDLTFTTGQTINAIVAPLADNGGPTLTHAPVAKSPLLEGGDSSTLVSGLSHDQRGFARISGVSVDIGAVEIGVAFVDAAGDYTITTDQGAPGLDAGDTVTWNGLFFGAAVSGLTFGSEAFLTVRDAVAAVSSSGNVYIAEGTYLEGAEINISKRVTLQGDGADITILSGNDAHRVLGLSGASTDVGLKGLTISDGNHSQGAGIFHAGGQLTIEACAILNSSANGSYAFGGGIYVSNGSTLTVSDSTLSGNTATGSSEGYGGAIWSSGTTQLINSTVSGNSVNFGGGGIHNTGSLELIHTTVTANGGMLSGAINSSGSATVSLNNSLIAGNSGGDLTTHSSGAAPTISGVNFIGFLASSKLVESSTVLCYNNTTASSASDVLEVALADNGGPTLTHALVLGGPALNAGDDAATPASMTTDQRGETRIFSTAVDIGAVEMIISPTLVSNDPAVGGARLPSDVSITLTFDQDVFAGDGAILLRRSDNDQAISSTVLISGNTVTITPTVNLPEGLDFYIEIEADALVNIAGQAFAGVSDSTTLAFGVCFSEVYVADAGDFSPANPAVGDTVTWTGREAIIEDLTFGLNALTSVPDAVDAVCVGGTIYMAEGSYTPGATVIITKDLTLQGDGASTILDGESSHTVLRVQSAANVTLGNLSIINGRSAPNSDGGALSVSGASVMINQCVFNGNSARDDGGAISSFNATVTIVDSTFTNNSADDSAGAFINLGSTFTVLNSTFSGNTAVKVGGVMTHVSGSTTLINSTFSGNSITGSGIGGRGGAIHTNGGQGDTLVSLINCTVTGNVASISGGGVFANGEESDVLYLSNCIIAGNTSTDVGPDVAGPITTRGANFIGDTAGATVSGTSTVSTFASTSTTINDLLDTTLADNGGPTLTHAIVVSSPAIDAGDNNSISEGILTDQRGEGFPRVLGSVVDLGAFEFTPSPIAIVSISPENGSRALSEDAVISIVFNQLLAVGSGNVLIKHAATDEVIQAIPVTSANLVGDTLTITPSPALPTGTSFYIEIESGALTNGFESDFAITGSATASFTTCFEEVYVDLALSGSADGDRVEWTGVSSTVSNLTFGLNTFATVQDGIDAACAGGTVFIAAGEFQQGSTITINKDLTLQGEGADWSTLSRDDSEGGGSTNKHSVVLIEEGAIVTIDSLTITGGRAADFYSAGGIDCQKSTVIVSHSTVSGNTAERGQSSGGIGGLGSTITVRHSIVSRNTVAGNYGCTGGIGGASSTITVSYCTVSGNTIEGGSSNYSSGGIGGSSSTITVSHSTVSGNSVRGEYIDSSSGGIGGDGPMITVSHSTVSANSVWGASTYLNSGGIGGEGPTITVNNCTVSGNSATGRSDIYGRGGIGGFNPTITMSNSIIVGNVASPTGINDEFDGDSLPTWTDNGGNFIGIPEGLSLGDILAPLADNGGPTLTHALVLGSPAIDAGDNDQIPDGISTDQRGVGFHRVFGSAVDIGAFEFLPAIAIDSITPDNGSRALTEDDVISIVFNQLLAVGSGNILIKNAVTDEVIQTIPVTSANLVGDTLTITPSPALPTGTSFYIEIESGALTNGFETDFAITGSATASFTTCFEEVYVDLALNGSADGDTVVWTGVSSTVSNLTFGLNAFVSVQDAVDAVCAGGTVYIAEGTYDEGAFINITKSVTLQGDGADYCVLSGGTTHSLINIQASGLDVTINDLALIESKGSPVIHASSTLTISRSVISDSQVGLAAISCYGDGTLTVIDSTISNNRSGFDTGSGIGVGFSANATIFNSTLSGNTANGGSGGAIVVETTGRVDVIHCTIINNRSTSDDYLGDGSLMVGGAGGGIKVFSGTLTVVNSIIAGNSATETGADISGTFISEGVNFIGDIAGSTGFRNGVDHSFASSSTTLSDVLNTTLADNGGPTLTHALVLGSPALNAGSNDTVPASTLFDQRGAGFTRIVGSAVDIGAYEIQNTPPVITLQGASVIRVECGIETYAELGATVADEEDGDLTDDLVIAGDTVDSNRLGEYTITYNVVDSFGAAAEEVTRTVIVEDTTAPVITLNGVSPVRIQAGIDSYTELGATVFDACDSSVAVVTGGDTVDTNTIGEYTITYNATDASSNAAVQVIRTVNVVAPPKFSITALSASVIEGDTGTVNATFTITRSGATERSGSIDWSIALAGDLTAADFVATSGTVEFDAESTSETLTVQIQGDNLAESDEAFTVTLSNALPTGALIDAANDSADGSINNDDSAPVANEDGLYEVVEDGSLTVLVANGVLANDTDADDGNGSPNLIVSSVIDDVEHGDLTLNEDGSFTYTPDEDYFGSDAFTYQVSDGTNTAQATANIRVNEQVDLAVAVEVLQDPLVAGGDAFAVFRITVINNGPSDATGVTLTQSSVLPSGVSLTGSVASTGSFAAGAWTLDLAEAASATLTLTLQASESANSGVDVLPFAIGVTAVDQPDSNSSNDAANGAISIISADDAELAISSVTTLSMQTGLLIGEVTITNEGAVTVPAFRVYVDNLPEDVQLYNRSGTADFGDPAQSLPYLLSNAALAAGESTTLRVEYYRPSLALDFEPVYLVELLPTTETPLPTAESGIPVERMLTMANGDIMIEFASVPGRRYAVEYTENLADGFIRIPQVVTAVANRLQWIDNGPPKTARHPSEAPSRFYRFVLLDID